MVVTQAEILADRPPVSSLKTISPLCLAQIGNSIRNDILDLNRSWIELRKHEGFNPQSKRTKSIELMIPHDSVESFPMHIPVFVVAIVMGMTTVPCHKLGKSVFLKIQLN
jgi:hypothetical protein